MALWDQWVDLIRMMIASYAQVCGGSLGGGVLLASLTVRVLLFPLTLKIAKASHRHQQAMKRLQPELDKLRKKYRRDSQRLGQEMQALFQRHKVAPFPIVGCFGSLAQLPIFIAMYAAVREAAKAGGPFLWIKNLAKPDVLLTCLVAATTYASVGLGMTSHTSEENKQLLLFIPVAVTVLVLLKTSAGLGIYWGVSSVAGACQSLIVHRSTLAESV